MYTSPILSIPRSQANREIERRGWVPTDDESRTRAFVRGDLTHSDTTRFPCELLARGNLADLDRGERERGPRMTFFWPLLPGCAELNLPCTPELDFGLACGGSGRRFLFGDESVRSLGDVLGREPL